MNDRLLYDYSLLICLAVSAASGVGLGEFICMLLMRFTRAAQRNYMDWLSI